MYPAAIVEMVERATRVALLRCLLLCVLLYAFFIGLVFALFTTDPLRVLP